MQSGKQEANEDEDGAISPIHDFGIRFGSMLADLAD
jgi:hypothetical protein